MLIFDILIMLLTYEIKNKKFIINFNIKPTKNIRHFFNKLLLKNIYCTEFI